MTNREFFTAVVNGTITEEMIEHAKAAIVKLDETNEKRKNKPSKTTVANEPILAQITETLTETPVTASDIAVACGISTQKASALLRQLVNAGVAVQSEVKLPKKGTVKAYAIVGNEPCEA